MRLTSQQAGPDALVDEDVRGVRQRCYADRPRDLVGLLEDALARSGPDVLLVDPTLGTTTTYDGFAAAVEGAAQALLSYGLVPDRKSVV